MDDDMKSPPPSPRAPPRCLGVAGSDLESERPADAAAGGLAGGDAARRFSDERDWGGGEARRVERTGCKASR
jgi:hypothetical protein